MADSVVRARIDPALKKSASLVLKPCHQRNSEGKMKTIFAMAALAVFLLRRPWPKSCTASKFLNNYDTGDQMFKNIANVAIVSEMDGVGWMNAYLTVDRKSEAAYCQPGKLNLTLTS